MILLPVIAMAQPAPVSLTSDGLSTKALIGGAALYHDSANVFAAATITDFNSLNAVVAKMESVKPADVTGYKGGKFLILFSVLNESPRPSFIVRYGYPSMQSISLLQFDEGGRLQKNLKSGKLVPAALRPMSDGEFLFPVQIEPGKVAHFAVALESNGSIQLPFEILTMEAMHEVTKTKYIFFGFYYGVTALILLYSLFLAVSLRKMTYLTYAFYIVSVIFAQMGLHGISYQYIWPNWHEWNKVSTIFFVGLMFVTLAAFTISSLGIKRHSRFFYYLLCLFGVVSGLVSISSLFFYGNFVIRCTGFLTTILPVVILPAGIVAWRKREKFAPFYVSAVTFYLFGASLYGLKDSGILPPSFLTENGILLGSIVEIAVLSLGIAFQIRNMNRESDQLRFDFEKANALSNIAAQISHDIRSPLSALNMAVSVIKDIPEDQRAVIRSAAQRINDIASDLLQQSKKNRSASTSQQQPMSARNAEAATPNGALHNPAPPAKISSATDESAREPVMLIELLETIVSEKRFQFRDRMDVEICADLSQGYGFFAAINTSDFARIISNCINNSVEAMKGPGHVLVAIRGDRDLLRIIVSDNGLGIPPEVLARIGELGFTYGKEGGDSGSGRGVFHARKTIEDAGGKFSIQSKVGEGTTITLTLPRAKSPQWFVNRIVASPELGALASL